MFSKAIKRPLLSCNPCTVFPNHTRLMACSILQMHTVWSLQQRELKWFVLGPIIFIIYPADLDRIVAEHGLPSHKIARDSQLYGSLSVCQYVQTVVWSSHRQLDAFQSASTQRKQDWGHYYASTVRMSQLHLIRFQLPVSLLLLFVVRDLGIFIDFRGGGVRLPVPHHAVSPLFASSVTAVCKSATTSFRSVVVLLVCSRLHYGNFIPVRLPAYHHQRLQYVLNAAARLMFRLRCYDNVSDALSVLHWLHTPQRINFKLSQRFVRYMVWRRPFKSSSSSRCPHDVSFVLPLPTNCKFPITVSLLLAGDQYSCHHTAEFSSRCRPIVTISLPSATEVIPIPEIISGYCMLVRSNTFPVISEQWF